MTQLLVNSELVKTPKSYSLPYLAQYSCQHLMCSNCSFEEYSLNAPKFTFSGESGVSNFYLPPLSGVELSSLALFFSTSASFPCSVVFDCIPGFAITASAGSNYLLNLDLKADLKILNFMGINDSSVSLQVLLDWQQLDDLADQVLVSTAICK